MASGKLHYIVVLLKKHSNARLIGTLPKLFFTSVPGIGFHQNEASAHAVGAES